MGRNCILGVFLLLFSSGIVAQTDISTILPTKPSPDGDSIVELIFQDETNNKFIITQNTGNTGMAFKPETSNPPNGSTSFCVQKLNEGRLFCVDHNGELTTTNEEMYFETENDGTGGFRAVHLGNLKETTAKDVILYTESFPSPSIMDRAAWCGKMVIFLGTGTGTLQFPSLGADPTNSQFQENCSFNIRNGNENVSINFQLPNVNHSWVVNDISNVLTSGTISVLPRTTLRVMAVDLTGVTGVDEKAFYIWTSYANP